MKKARGRYHHGSLREAAIVAAAREIDQHGHQGVTLDRVTKRLGVTPAALYRHFANREALLYAVIWDAFTRFAARMDEAARSGTTPRDVLLGTMHAYVSFALENPGWFRLQFSRAGSTLSRDHENKLELAYPGLMRDALRALLGPRADLEPAFLMVWSFVHGLSGLLVEDVLAHVKTDAERLELADQMGEAFIATLTTAEASPAQPRRRASQRART